MTTLSIATANGLAGTVATATTTPVVTLTTTINSPLLAGNGTAIAAAATVGSGSTAVLSVSPTLTASANASALVLTGGTLTASAPVLSATQTWNNVAVTFTGILLNVTATPSAAGSLLMDLQEASSTQFRVRKDGAVTAQGPIQGVGIVTNNGGNVSWASSTVMTNSGTDGWLTVSNNAQNNFGLLGLGGTTTSFPALKRSSATVQARLGDDSAFTFMQAQLQTSVNATTGLTAGVLAALTNASIVIYDGAGQAYRVPCII